MKIFFALLMTLVSSAALAQTITCPNVGKMILNGDTVDMTYNYGSRFNNDIGYFFSMSNDNSYFRLTNWSAEVEIPNALVDRRVQTAEVTFTSGATQIKDTCTVH